MNIFDLRLCIRLFLPALALASAALPAGAQRANRTVPQRRIQNRAVLSAGQPTSPLQTVHQTLQRAVKVMQSALPIYDGHRHRAIELTHLAEQELHEATLHTGGGTSSQ